MKAAADTFRANPAIDVATAITELKIGEALVSLLQPDGSPEPVQRTLIKPPRSRVGPLTPQERQVIITTDADRHRSMIRLVDREFAEEILNAKAAEAAAAAAAAQAKTEAEKAAAEQAKLDAQAAKAKRRRRPPRRGCRPSSSARPSARKRSASAKKRAAAREAAQPDDDRQDHPVGVAALRQAPSGGSSATSCCAASSADFCAGADGRGRGPAPCAGAAIAGLYQAHQMEVGAALELSANGHFRYQLDYGAVAEQAEGDWTFDGKTVRLTTQANARSCRSFELVRDDPAPAGEVYDDSRTAGLRR